MAMTPDQNRGDDKQATLDHTVVHHMRECGGRAGGRPQADAQDNVANLREAGPGEQSLEVRLINRGDGPCDHGDTGQPAKQFANG